MPVADEYEPEEPEYEDPNQEIVTLALKIEILKLNGEGREGYERKKDKYNARMTKSKDDCSKAIAIFQQLLEYGSQQNKVKEHSYGTLRNIQQAFDSKWSSGNDQTKDDIIECLKAATDQECGDLQRLGTWMNLSSQLEIMGQLPDKDDLFRIFCKGTKNEFVRTTVIVPNQAKLPSDRLSWKEMAETIQEILDKILMPNSASDIASTPAALVVAHNALVGATPMDPKRKHCRYCGSYDHLANACNADKCLNCNALFNGYADRKYNVP